MENYYYIQPKKDIDPHNMCAFIALETEQGLFYLENTTHQKPIHISDTNWKESGLYQILEATVHICNRCGSRHILQQPLCEMCDYDDYFKEDNKPEYLECFDPQNSSECDDNIKTGCLNCYQYNQCKYDHS